MERINQGEGAFFLIYQITARHSKCTGHKVCAGLQAHPHEGGGVHIHRFPGWINPSLPVQPSCYFGKAAHLQ